MREGLAVGIVVTVFLLTLVAIAFSVVYMALTGQCT